jgi:bifunctional DNase/RNase
MTYCQVRHRFLMALTIGLAVSTPASAQSAARDSLITVEVATVGVGLITRAPVVILHDPVSDKTMPVWVGTAEAEAIARALFGIKPARPMTHDLLADMIKSLDASVEEVVVTDSRDGVYYGRVHLRTKEKELVDVDSRPSDGVALALRTGAPIRVSKRLLEEAEQVTVMPDENNLDFARALGLTVVSPTDEVRRLFKLPKRDGVIVVEANGEAAEAGIKRGDLIFEANGRTPKTAQEFWEAVRTTRSGSTSLRYWRDGKENEIKVGPRRRESRPGAPVPA